MSLSRSLKIAQTKVRNILNVFNPSRYTPEVVNANKDSWIKKAEDAFDVVTELSLDLEECVSQDEAQDILNSNEALMDEIAKFVFSINIAALSSNVLHPQASETSFDVSENQPKLDHGQFPTFPQSQCLESEPRGCIPDSIKIINDASPVEIIQTEVEDLIDIVQSVLQNQLKLVSVDQRFRGQVFNYGTVSTVLLPIQETHVMLQMSSGSIQRRVDSIFIYLLLSCMGAGVDCHQSGLPPLSSMNVLEELPLRSVARALDREVFQPQMFGDSFQHSAI